ncbi:NPCBM/NEW2 domain-containing protein [Streptomyces sp. NBC_01210]|uniref:NPCBM/NEW2 domain-containing protein n=1 Tax=Streptomyces sp. NBC_01210 TaxID=2903774 RepID=UPI002E141217|nr:NPCBM/NEW2 domain-containing protein [Streptomyces sp. NBC_01210]
MKRTALHAEQASDEALVAEIRFDVKGVSTAIGLQARGHRLLWVRRPGGRAYAELHRRHRDAVRDYAQLYCAAPGYAEDLVSAVFSQAALTSSGSHDPVFRITLLQSVLKVATEWAGTPRRELLDEEFLQWVAFNEDLGIDAVPVDDTQALVLRMFYAAPGRAQVALWHTVTEGESPDLVGLLLGANSSDVASFGDVARRSLREAILQEYMSRATAPGCRYFAAHMDFAVRDTGENRPREFADHLAGCVQCEEIFGLLTRMPRTLQCLLPIAVLRWRGADYAELRRSDRSPAPTFRRKRTLTARIVVPSLALVSIGVVSLLGYSALRPDPVRRPSASPPSLPGSSASPSRSSVPIPASPSRPRLAGPSVDLEVSSGKNLLTLTGRLSKFTSKVSALGAEAALNVSVDLTGPAGWEAHATSKAFRAKLTGGKSLSTAWEITAPRSAAPGPYTLTLTATYQSPAGSRVSRQMPLIAQLGTPPAGNSRLSDLIPKSSFNGWGPLEKNTSNGEFVKGDGKPMTIDGEVFRSGLGVHAPSTVEYYLGGRCSRVTARVGLDDEAEGQGSVAFEIWVDGKKGAATGILRGRTSPQRMTADVDGAESVLLVVSNGDDDNDIDHADWADPMITCRAPQ